MYGGCRLKGDGIIVIIRGSFSWPVRNFPQCVISTVFHLQLLSVFPATGPNRQLGPFRNRSPIQKLVVIGLCLEITIAFIGNDRLQSSYTSSWAGKQARFTVGLNRTSNPNRGWLRWKGKYFISSPSKGD